MRGNLLALLLACVTLAPGSVCVARAAPAPDSSHHEAPHLRYLALGDSYTIGEGVAAGDRWPVQFAAWLRGHGPAIDDPVIIARTGWTTDELDAAITAAPPQGPFELVTLQIGVNNQFRGRDLAEFRRQFAALLVRATDLTAGGTSHITVLSIPDWSVTPFAAGRDRAAIAADIDRFNAVCAEESRAAGAIYVNITPISRAAAHDRSLLADDGLHPSRVMYARWVEAISKAWAYDLDRMDK
jgi:lysophospholipase L1-like esterase